MSTKGQHGNVYHGREEMKRLGVEGGVLGGWVQHKGSKVSECKRAVCNASGCCLLSRDTSHTALSLSDRMRPGGHTQN